MRITPSLLLFLLLVFVFSPSLIEWVTRGGSQWYRPYIVWLIIIIIAAWAQRRRAANDL